MADSLFIAGTLLFNRSIKTCRVNASELCDSFGRKCLKVQDLPVVCRPTGHHRGLVGLYHESRQKANY